MGYNGFTGVVSVMQDADGEVILHSGVVYARPEHLDFTHRTRAACRMDILPRAEGEKYPLARIDWIEALDQGGFSAVLSGTGNDGVDVNVTSPLTCLEDGFLTLYYTTWWGEHPVHHDFVLVSDPADPYILELRHDAHGDGHHEMSEGIIFFDVSVLPDTGGEHKILTLNWTRTDGSRSTAQFDFDTAAQ